MVDDFDDPPIDMRPMMSTAGGLDGLGRWDILIVVQYSVKFTYPPRGQIYLKYHLTLIACDQMLEKSSPKFSKSCQKAASARVVFVKVMVSFDTDGLWPDVWKSSHTSFDLKGELFKIAQESPNILVTYLCKKIRCQELLKIAQFGNTQFASLVQPASSFYVADNCIEWPSLADFYFKIWPELFPIFDPFSLT